MSRYFKFRFNDCGPYYQYNLLVVVITTVWLLQFSLVAGLEYKGLSKEELIRQQCDGLPTSRRLLTVTANRQKKEYQFLPADQVAISDGTPASSNSTCDVWDFQTSSGFQKWVAVVLTRMRFQQNDALFVVREADAGVTRIERFGLDLRSTGFSSKGPLTLLWVRRNGKRNGSTPELEEGRKLDFLYFSDDASKDEEENNEDLVLISGIVLSFITLSATVLSLVRAAGCQSRFLPYCLRRHRHTIRRHSNSYTSVTPRADDEPSRNSTASTVTASNRPSPRAPEAILLMEMEVQRPASFSFNGDNDINNNNNNNESEDDVYQRMLPPHYDQVIGHLVNFQPDNRPTTTNADQPPSIPETNEETTDNESGQLDGEAMGQDEIGDAYTDAVHHNLQHLDLVPRSSLATDYDLHETYGEASISAPSSCSTALPHRNVIDTAHHHCTYVHYVSEPNGRTHNEDDEQTETKPLDLPPSSSSTANCAIVTRPVQTSAASPPTPSSMSASSSLSRSSTLPLRSRAVLTPVNFRPRLRLLPVPQCRGTASDSAFGLRHVNPVEIQFSITQNNTSTSDSVGVADSEEAPPPSYYDESPPPSYDSIFLTNNN